MGNSGEQSEHFRFMCQISDLAVHLSEGRTQPSQTGLVIQKTEMETAALKGREHVYGVDPHSSFTITAHYGPLLLTRVLKSQENR